MASTSRQQQKQETRERILATARSLFAERGFEPTTIRAIAESAGVSPGAVIGHFNSKISLLMEITREVNRQQLSLVRKTLPPEGDLLSRVMHMLRIYAAFDLENPSLAAVVLGYSWTWGAEVESGLEDHFAPGDALMRSILQLGVERGEVRADIDIDLAVKMIFALYTRNLRQSIYGGLTSVEASERLEPQLTILRDGLQKAG